jgi:hypothetical protein
MNANTTQEPGGIFEAMKIVAFIPNSGGEILGIFDNVTNWANQEGMRADTARKLIAKKRPYTSRTFKREAAPRYVTGPILKIVQEKRPDLLIEPRR